MSRFGIVGLALVFALGFGCSPKPTTDGSQMLDGQWTPIELNDNGTIISGDRLKNITIGFNESKYIRGEVSGPNGASIKAASGEFSVRVDITKTPHEIDLTSLQGPNIGQMHQGIFEMKDGNLHLCLGALNEDRPTTFAAGPKCSNMVLKKKN